LKKSQKLISAVVVLIILGAALVFLKREPAEEIVKTPIVTPVEKPFEKPDDKPETPEKERGPKNIISLNRDLVSSIEFISVDKKILMENKDSQWVVNEGKVNRINNGKIFSILRELLNLKTVETVSFSSDDREQWGISDKSDKVLIKSGGKTISLLIGSLNPAQTGYYVQIEGVNEIYLIKSSYGESIKIALDDLRIRDLPKIDIGKISTITIKNDSIIQIVPFERSDMFTAEMFAYMMSEPYRNQIPVHSENLEKFLLKMEAPLQIVDFIDTGNPGDYGINEIKLSIKEDSGRSFDLLLGREAGKEKIYSMIKGEDQIFTLNKKDLPFLNLKPFDLVDRFPHLISINSIDALQITTDEMAIMGTIDRRDEGSTYSINGMEIDEKAFKTFYQDVLYLLMEGETEQPVSTENPEITISFKLYDGGSYWTHLNFYPYNSEFYAVARNEDEPAFIIGRYQLKEMLKKVTKTVDTLMGF